MFRIDDPTAAASLPTPGSPGTEGYFTEGNPGGGVAATRVTADFLNMLQEENVTITTAGGVTRSKTARNQVLAALINILGVKHNVSVLTPTGSGSYVSLVQISTTIAVAGTYIIEGWFGQAFSAGYKAWKTKLTVDIAGANTDYSEISGQAIQNAVTVKAFVATLTAGAHTFDLMWQGADNTVSATPALISLRLTQ